MAADILLGLVLGVIIVAVVSPVRGVLFIILEQRKQIEFLSAQHPQQPEAEANGRDDR